MRISRQAVALIGFYLPCLVVQAAGGAITALSVANWYPALAKSSLTPPGYVFGIVWTFLYILMAVAAWRLWLCTGRWNSPAHRLWLAQLVAGLLWTSVFFGMRLLHEGLAVIACLWVLLLFTLRRFAAIDRLAAGLLVPLFLWVSFAVYLQAQIVRLN